MRVMVKNKAVLLDRDGILNEDLGYVDTIGSFKWLIDAKDALRFFKQEGYLLIVISNQSGVARGLFSEKDIKQLHKHLQRQILQSHQIQIDAFYYCPHHPEGIIDKYRKVCSCRKPNSGLFEQAIRELCIDPHQSLAIGDRETDLIPAMNVGVPGLFLLDVKRGYLCKTSNRFVVVNSWKELMRHHKK